VVGQYVFVDTADEVAPADAYVFDEREPTLGEWYAAYGLDSVRTIRADPWSTWELREHWGQTPNPPPTGTPSDLRELRIAHNVAVASGDAATAQRLRERIVRQLDTHVAVSFVGGTKLLGERYLQGVEPKLETIFSCTGPTPDEAQFEIEAQVTEKRPLSWVPADARSKKVGMPFVLPPHLWRAGFLYEDRSSLYHRPGVESFLGRFVGSDAAVPHPVDGAAWVDLLTLR